jgi:amino acid permease
MTLWTDRVPDYGWILMAWAFFQTISLLGVAMYGESKQPQRFSLRKLTQISGILASLFQIPLCALQFPGRHPNQHRRHWGITSDLDTGKIRDFLLTESTASGRRF